MAKKPYIRYASLAHEIDRHNKITPTPVASFQRAIFLPSLTTCWSKLMLPLMDYQRWCCLDYYWYLPTCRTLTSPLKRNLPSITLPICHCQAVCHRNWGTWGSTGMEFPVNTTVYGQPFLQWYCAEEPSISCLEIRVCQCLLLFLGSTVSKHPWHCKRHCRPGAQACNPTTSQFCACCWLPQSKVQPLNVATLNCDMRRMFIAAPWKNAKPFHSQK